MSPPSVSLLMAIHFHQPVGNFGFVVEQAFRQSYEPFVSVLERHPTVRMALHYSGTLLDWLREHQPDLLARVKRLVARNQVELLASGYYEPILPVIPPRDQEAQIALMQEALTRWSGRRPTGLWLTERVWEPELPTTLARCGIAYTMLDGNQFRPAQRFLPPSLQAEDEGFWDLFGCYATDHAGAPVVLFPTSKRLRYWLPFQEVSRTIEWLRRLACEQPVAVTYADDGEKFGLWPKTHAWVYEQGWLERFFSALEQESSWLKTATFGDYLSAMGPSGRVYLPCGSYDEMVEWSGGYFRNFFVKYPEAQAMRGKMLWLSRRLEAAQNNGAPSSPAGARRGRSRAPGTPGAARQLARAQQALFKAQCNDAYWHGVFGGLYLGNLRRVVHGHLIQAQQLLDQATKQTSGVRAADVDMDGRPELILRNASLSLTVDPDDNGAVTELAHLGRAVNLLDTLSRRFEPYHEKLRARAPAAIGTVSGPASIHDQVQVKEEGLEGHLAYDDHRRSAFWDEAWSTTPSLQALWRCATAEYRLWPAGAWEVEDAPRGRRTGEGAAGVCLRRRVREGWARKTVTLDPKAAAVEFRYELKGVEAPVVGLEFNLGLRDVQWLSPRWQEHVHELRVAEPAAGVAVRMRLESPAAVASFPIETVSDSEEGLERTFQGLALVLIWPVGAARDWSCGLRWVIEEL